MGVSEAWQIAGATGKTQMLDWSFDWNDRYNVVGSARRYLPFSLLFRYRSESGGGLSGKTLQESRLGLIFNGFIKIPMQTLVLAVGVMVFVFYQFEQPPLHFNQANLSRSQVRPKRRSFKNWKSRMRRFLIRRSRCCRNFSRPAKPRILPVLKQPLASYRAWKNNIPISVQIPRPATKRRRKGRREL